MRVMVTGGAGYVGSVTVERHFAGGAFDFEVPAVSTGDLTSVLSGGHEVLNAGATLVGVAIASGGELTLLGKVISSGALLSAPGLSAKPENVTSANAMSRVTRVAKCFLAERDSRQILETGLNTLQAYDTVTGIPDY